MKCEKCQAETQVYDSRPKDDTIKRRRKCVKCKHRFTTVEMYLTQVNQIVDEVVPKPEPAPPPVKKRKVKPRHGAVFMTRPNKLKSATKTYNLLMRQKQWDMLSRKSHELTTLTKQQVSAADIIRLCIDMNMEETCNEIERRYRAQNY